MHALYGKKIILAILLCSCCFATSLMSQRVAGNYNFQDFQAKQYYFGLTLGYNHANFQLFHSGEFILNDSFAVAKPMGGPGFNVSIVTNLKIGRYFDFRFLPGFSFAERSILFESTDPSLPPRKNTLESVFVQAPFQVRFKSEPYKDKRLFLAAGVKYTYDVATNARVRKDQSKSLIRISPHDYSVEFGAGVQFFFPFFIFSPEIKFSQGISNIMIYNPSLEQSRILEKILSRSFTFSLHFEG